MVCLPPIVYLIFWYFAQVFFIMEMLQNREMNLHQLVGEAFEEKWGMSHPEFFLSRKNSE
jgi:hypothetical protein